MTWQHHDVTVQAKLYHLPPWKVDIPLRCPPPFQRTETFSHDSEPDSIEVVNSCSFGATSIASTSSQRPRPFKTLWLFEPRWQRHVLNYFSVKAFSPHCVNISQHAFNAPRSKRHILHQIRPRPPCGNPGSAGTVARRLHKRACESYPGLLCGSPKSCTHSPRRLPDVRFLYRCVPAPREARSHGHLFGTPLQEPLCLRLFSNALRHSRCARTPRCGTRARPSQPTFSIAPVTTLTRKFLHFAAAPCRSDTRRRLDAKVP